MTATEPLQLLHLDEHLVAVNKPHSLAVHRSRLVGDDEDYLIDRLRLQVEGRLHAVHRLDRATSGVLLVARSQDIAAELGRQLMARTVDKSYLAVVRGWPAEQGEIDYPLSGASLRGEAKPALTRWRRLATVEVPIESGRYAQQRYALLDVQPETGRYRQIRRHFHHVSHHLLGDTSHGRGDHNRLIRQHYGVHRLLLHAWRLRVVHPATRESLRLEAPLDESWQRLLRAFQWSGALPGDDALRHPDAAAASE
ncbi:pseudouridine synthase [Dokdonella sp.]|uniref:pseudouridine synthase n=1 Tax=Dokdonella sp. TaxID=2291710 RepID=UPI001B0574F7|nr:pseudouridine synthase [Dokdonella sp.]MBO9664544.1 pseudouridylate synthase [Dokdonella sp.]